MTGRFTTRPAVLPLPGDRWAFDEPLTWHQDDGTAVTVPQGYAMDGAWIPRAFWSTIGHPMRTDFVYAAGVHDFECGQRQRPSAEVHRRFGAMLAAEGVGRVRRTLMTAAVRWFGPSWEMPR